MAGIVLERIRREWRITRKRKFMSFFLLFAASFAQTGPSQYSGRIAFLKNGEVWISDLRGRGLQQVTHESGKVDDFLFSPGLSYLAYARVIWYVDEPGLWDDTQHVPQRAVCSIVIMNLQAHKVLKEILPTEDTWIYVSKWLPEGKLLYYSSSGFDVSGYSIYDIRKDAKEEVDYAKGSRLSNTEFAIDGSLTVYVDDCGLGKEFKENLHLVDAKTKANRILVSKRSIADLALSNDRRRIAFVEVEDVEKKYFDNLWVFDLKDGTLRNLHRGPAKAKVGGKSELSWSFDDRYIGMFFSPTALVLDVNHPGEVLRVQGSDWTWAGNSSIVFAQGNRVYLYSPESGKSELLFENATKPAFLRKKDY
jgi:Tol biopolymer transport system component